MTRLCIRNFGPVKDGFTASADGFFDIYRITLFIGGQGTGKSTVAKLVSVFLWLEKQLMQGVLKPEDVTAGQLFRKLLLRINFPRQKNV